MDISSALRYTINAAEISLINKQLNDYDQKIVQVSINTLRRYIAERAVRENIEIDFKNKKVDEKYLCDSHNREQEYFGDLRGEHGSETYTIN